jgi:hypothetical protein
LCISSTSFCPATLAYDLALIFWINAGPITGHPSTAALVRDETAPFEAGVVANVRSVAVDVLCRKGQDVEYRAREVM